VKRRSGFKRSAAAGKSRTPGRTVFLSYSWDSPPHQDWISKFAFRLKANGIKVVIDQWNLTLGGSLARFMEAAIESSDFVLLICTPEYKKRADERAGGVGYEQDLMIAERSIVRNYNKFIPVLRAGDWYSALPKWISGHLGVDLRDHKYAEDNFQNLVDYLRSAPVIRR